MTFTTKKEFCTDVSNIAIKALLYEVSTTPKPGLVDRNNSGAHKDMDYFTFLSSTASQIQTFYNCALWGVNTPKDQLHRLLERIRPIGIKAEEKMLDATKGVNTHKGLIFSLGIISAVSGYLYGNGENITVDAICATSRAMAKGICEKELCDLKRKDKLTHGEKLYLTYGIKGIRGEVESGFETVRNYALPMFKQEIEVKKHNVNLACVHVIMALIAHTEDSNILARTGMNGLRYAKSEASQLLTWDLDNEVAFYDLVNQLDKDFIEKNISPGGAADLLAITLMLYLLEVPNGI